MRFDRDLDKGMGVEVDEFYMDRAEVTNGQFKEFVEAMTIQILPTPSSLTASNFLLKSPVFHDASDAWPSPLASRTTAFWQGRFPCSRSELVEARAFANGPEELPTLFRQFCRIPSI